MILAGDIGGTNTRLAYFRLEQGQPQPITVEIYPSAQHSCLEDIVAQFIKSHQEPIDGACFGIAGPVINGVCKTPNLPWVVDSRKLSSLLKLQQIDLINDLEANAHGISVLSDTDLVVLNAGKPAPNGNAALISAGTGLGQAGLLRDGSGYRPFASEGGHVDFAPRNNLEIELLTHLLISYEHVSYERVLSGPGLVNIYKFLIATDRGKEPSWLTEQMQQMDPAVAITKAAIQNKCAPCSRAMDLLVSFYGAQAGNVAMTILATAGIFIGGGIAPRIIDYLKKPIFLESLFEKGRMKRLLSDIPVKVIVNDQTALLGAACVALNHCKDLDPNSE